MVYIVRLDMKETLYIRVKLGTSHFILILTKCIDKMQRLSQKSEIDLTSVDI